MRDDVILVGHGLPLAVFLLHVLLQVEAALLGNVVLLEKGLKMEICGNLSAKGHFNTFGTFWKNKEMPPCQKLGTIRADQTTYRSLPIMALV